MSLVESVRTRAAPYGLNLVAAAPAQRYDRRVRPELRCSTQAPDARSVVLVGNGGRALWQALIRHAAGKPGWWQRAHPLDDFISGVVEAELLPALDGACVGMVYPFSTTPVRLDFIELARAVGLGGPSLLGVLVHPVFGPWIAFRAALLLAAELDAPGPALGFDPCSGCASRSCIAACPVAAVTYPEGWSVGSCSRFRIEHEATCNPGCHARLGCVLAPEHRYTADELAYHQRRALGVMRDYLGGPGAPSLERP